MLVLSTENEGRNNIGVICAFMELTGLGRDVNGKENKYRLTTDWEKCCEGNKQGAVR